MPSATVELQQDGAPAHIFNSATFPARAKFLLLVEKLLAASLARRQVTGLPSGRTIRLGRAMLGIQTLSPSEHRTTGNSWP